MVRKRILYCIHVPWSWIKQRPHFLAEGLSRDYDLTVVDRAVFSKYTNNAKTVKLYHLFRVPFERLFIISIINNLLYRIQYFFIGRKKDWIWVTHPLQFANMGTWINNKRVIYDCMDDMIALARDKREAERIEKYERLLLKRADVVFSSSLYLKEHLIEKYGTREIVVVNNAITDRIASYGKSLPESPQPIFDKSKMNIVYIGTISNWFNFDLVHHLLNNNPRVVVNLFGPTEVDIPKHDRIRYLGSVEHQYITGIMDSSDALIMPFIVNDLIKAVNPVKLYEYIYSGKPCVAPDYGETRCFEPYVFLYKSESDFVKIVNNIEAKEIVQKSLDECQRFALSNTWDGRVEQIEAVLN